MVCSAASSGAVTRGLRGALHSVCTAAGDKAKLTSAGWILTPEDGSAPGASSLYPGSPQGRERSLCPLSTPP